ncbi:MAG: hypothetical protein V2I43_04105 [Parvularcula sp.]|jgi:hypothetical protein|nr:hypothetical protein [Parvularcula sp.]
MNSPAVEILDGGILVRPSEWRRRTEGRYAVCIFGASRGGTSAAAYALARAGFPMGDDMRANCEDPAFLELITEDRIDRAGLERLVRQRWSEYPRRWGFKVPAASFHLRSLSEAIENIVFVGIIRSPLASARTIFRREPAFSKGNPVANLQAALRHSMRYYEAAIADFARLSAPVLLLDHETARFQSEQFVSTLFGALNFETVKAQTVATELAEGRYRNPYHGGAVPDLPLTPSA